MTEKELDMRSRIEAEVIAILADQALLQRADVPPDSKLDDLGLDSLGKVEAIFAMEERFDISIPFNANNPEDPGFDISSVQSIVSAIEKLIESKAG
jgi:acyl carrier protein